MVWCVLCSRCVMCVCVLCDCGTCVCVVRVEHMCVWCCNVNIVMDFIIIFYLIQNDLKYVRKTKKYT